MKIKSIAAVFALLPMFAFAQELKLEDQLPTWAAKQLANASSINHLQVLSGINPFFQRGDFDGDGKADFAILVQEQSTKKIGILIVSRREKSVLLGAGHSFGNLDDDLAWVELWVVEDKGTTQLSYSEPKIKLRADGILLVKEGSVSGLIYYKNGSYKWQQQGD